MCLNNSNAKLTVDTVFINGNIHTMDKNNSICEAIGVKDGVIFIVGENTEVLKYTNQDTEIIDLCQRTVIPGFIDAHCNIPQKNMINSNMISLFNFKSQIEYIEEIKLYINCHPDQEIIYGEGVKAELINDEEWINKIDSYKIIIIKDYSNQILYLNTKAVKYFDIIRRSDGFLRINEKNTGKVKGNVINKLSLDWYFKYKDKDYINAFEQYQKKAHKYGITTIGLTDTNNRKIPIEIYRRLEITKRLKLRINYGIEILPKNICNKTIYEQIHELKRNRIIYKTKLFDVSHADFVLDGTTEAKMSYLFKPYRNYEEKNYNGVLLWDFFELQEGVKMANRLDFNSNICARGDNACKIAMDAIEYSARKNENHKYRNSIVHLNLVTKYYMRRMKLLNISAIVNPFWFYKNSESSKLQVDALGEDRVHRLYPFKSLIDEGIIIASASDYYVEDEPNPINAIECAVCRNLYCYENYKLPQKIDMSDFKYGLNPSEKITVNDAIKSFTINAAYVLGVEEDVGSLERGKKADFILLDKDIFNVSHLDISTVKVTETYFNGRCVYSL